VLYQGTTVLTSLGTCSTTEAGNQCITMRRELEGRLQHKDINDLNGHDSA